MSTETAERISSAQILRFLESRYAAPQWAAFREVELRGRRIDLVAMGLWERTRNVGFRAIGVEVKVSRADFMRELDAPDKRAPAEKLMHECYFATPQGLVRLDEVPEGWGLLEVSAAGLKRTKAPTQRRPEPTWELCSAIARRSRYVNGNHDAAARSEPVAAWKYAGQELTEEQLMKVAEETWEAQVATRLEAARRQAAAQAQRDHAHADDQLNAFFQVLGVNTWERREWPVERIRTELAKSLGGNPAKLARLRNALAGSIANLQNLASALDNPDGNPDGVTGG
jgi:hypothetical protein